LHTLSPGQAQPDGTAFGFPFEVKVEKWTTEPLQRHKIGQGQQEIGIGRKA
jgi:hypothetical protein